MSLSRLFPSQQLFFAVTIAALALFQQVGQALDSVTATSGIVRSGEITGVKNGNIMLKTAQAEIGIPLSQATSVTLAAPPEYARALQLQEAGHDKEALALLKPLGDNFAGLPVDWAAKSTSLIGDLNLTLGKNAEAAAAYLRYKKLYPSAAYALQASVGLARIAFASQKTSEAAATLAPIAAAAVTRPDLSAAESSAYGQAFFTLGNIAEKDGKLSEALHDYLLTVTVFYADRSTTARAQDRADALRKNSSVSVP